MACAVRSIGSFHRRRRSACRNRSRPRVKPSAESRLLNDGSCVRLQPERPNHIWSYDFVRDHTEDKRKFRMLTVIDEFTRR